MYLNVVPLYILSTFSTIKELDTKTAQVALHVSKKNKFKIKKNFNNFKEKSKRRNTFYLLLRIFRFIYCMRKNPMMLLYPTLQLRYFSLLFCSFISGVEIASSINCKIF